MVFTTISVCAAVTPTVIETYFAHYLNRKPLRQRPTAHISYHEGLQLIRQFLYYASHHTVEDLQAFTSQWVPNPRWVKVDEITIPEEHIDRSADLLSAQLGHKGIDQIGGSKWWQWRRDGCTLKAEWIEMRAHHARRKQIGEKSQRVILYVHGGAYFFGSVDEHRYQMQRHARKLEARVLARSSAARYRLAPQFPFPCGLHDCLAAYLYLLTEQDPSTIILAGDSAGGGMVMRRVIDEEPLLSSCLIYHSMLITLRDQSLPLPAGAILVSPWVDLTHSFPSLSGDGQQDYIPTHGFLHRPSAAWPPPNANDMQDIALHAVEKAVGDGLPRRSSQQARQKARQKAIQGFPEEHDPQHLHATKNVNNPAGTNGAENLPGDTIPGPGHDLSIMLDGKLVHIKDQIQLYATNQLISHPLVSPVLSPSLGGLPPLLILTGGGELLRDEQIYLAHKAANPTKYPPSEAFLIEHPEARDIINKYKPTDVQLQVWDDLCHVAPTLSFTRPAKYMFRSVAQFGAWALARAQETDIDIMDDDDVSVISSESNTDSESTDPEKPAQTPLKMRNGVARGVTTATESIGKAGKPLPPFQNHMIRQRVDRHGDIFPLEPASSMPALQMSPNEVGVIKPGPVRKWLAAKKEWDSKFAKDKRRVQKQRIKEMAQGFQDFGEDDAPPPSALAGRRGLHMPKEERKGRSWGLSLWSLWGSKHDQSTMQREEKADKSPETNAATPIKASHDGITDTLKSPKSLQSRSRSRRRTVTYTRQAGRPDEETPAAELLRRRESQKRKSGSLAKKQDPLASFLNSGGTSLDLTRTDSKAKRHSGVASNNKDIAAPNHDDIAFKRPGLSDPPTSGIQNIPLTLKGLGDEGVNASTVALKEFPGVPTPRVEANTQLSDSPRANTIVDSIADHLDVLNPAGEGIQNTPLTLKTLGDEGVNASTVALKDYPGVRTPGEADKQLSHGKDEYMVTYCGDGRTFDGGIGNAVGGREEGGQERPGIERFETAREEI